MPSLMTHRERLFAALRDAETDRPPISLWRHWPHQDQSTEGLIHAHLRFQETYDCDLIKVSPSGSYAVEDWGVKTEFRGRPDGTRDYLNTVIHSPADWERLQPLSPHKGMLGVVVAALRGLREELRGQTPFIATIFSPLTMAAKLAGPRYLDDLREHPAALHAGLRTLARSAADLARASVDAGAAGIFFATQHASRQTLTEAEFAEFGEPYDQEVLTAVRGALIVVHLHGEDVRFDRVAGWPGVSALNWHDRRTPPSLAQAQERFPGALIGGLDEQNTLLQGTPAQVTAQVHDAIAQTGGRRLIVGPGCVILPATPADNLAAARRAVDSYR